MQIFDHGGFSCLSREKNKKQKWLAPDSHFEAFAMIYLHINWIYETQHSMHDFGTEKSSDCGRVDDVNYFPFIASAIKLLTHILRTMYAYKLHILSSFTIYRYVPTVLRSTYSTVYTLFHDFFSRVEVERFDSMLKHKMRLLELTFREKKFCLSKARCKSKIERISPLEEIRLNYIRFTWAEISRLMFRIGTDPLFYITYTIHGNIQVFISKLTERLQNSIFFTASLLYDY